MKKGKEEQGKERRGEEGRGGKRRVGEGNERGNLDMFYAGDINK